jgi:hypothetical protein
VFLSGKSSVLGWWLVWLMGEAGEIGGAGVVN